MQITVSRVELRIRCVFGNETGVDEFKRVGDELVAVDHSLSLSV